MFNFKNFLLCVCIGTIFFTQALISMAEEAPSDYAKEMIAQYINEGLLPELIANSYQKSITRAEFCSLLSKVLSKKDINVKVLENPFDDIDNSIYKDDIIKTYKTGIIKGYGNGTFGPDELITREQICVLLTRLILFISPNEVVKLDNSYDFVDIKQISSWALEFVNYCYDKKIIRGIAELKIAPKMNVTREQSIILLYLVYKNYETTPVIFIEQSSLQNDSYNITLINEVESFFNKLKGEKNVETQSRGKEYFESSFSLKNNEIKILFEVNSDNQIQILLKTTDLSHKISILYFKELMDILDKTSVASSLLDNKLNKFNENQELNSFVETISNNIKFGGVINISEKGGNYYNFYLTMDALSN